MPGPAKGTAGGGQGAGPSQPPNKPGAKRTGSEGKITAGGSNDKPQDDSKPYLPARSSESRMSTHSILKVGKKTTKPASAAHADVNWNEENIKETFHPEGKDYGNIPVDEPKTPFNYDMSQNQGPVSADVLAQRIEAARQNIPHAIKIKREEDHYMTAKEKEHQLEFEKKRKMHYNEFELVKQARERHKLGLDDEDEDEDTETGKPKGKPPDDKSSKGKLPGRKASDIKAPESKASVDKKPSPSTK
ncbi:putative protein phosphatase inhibitor 2-like protein 1 [Haemaphysalis longicornis]